MYPKGNLFIPASHGQLEAIIKEPKGEARCVGIGLVCHPHPLGGGTMHNKVVFRAAAGLVDAGLIALRFNFRGVGASTGVHNEIEGGIEDTRDALHWLEQKYLDREVTLAGFSFGSRVGLPVGIADDRVKRLISIGTPVDKYEDYDFLLEIRKPILFIHGDHDEFGNVEHLKRVVDQLAQKNAEAELVVVPNSGHFFDEHLNLVRETVKNWVLKQLNEN